MIERFNESDIGTTIKFSNDRNEPVKATIKEVGTGATAELLTVTLQQDDRWVEKGETILIKKETVL